MAAKLAKIATLVAAPLLIGANDRSFVVPEGDDMVQLARRTCLAAEMYYGHENAGEKVEIVLAHHANIDLSAPDARRNVLKFWNAVDEWMICDIDSHIKPYVRNPQHLLKRVVDLRMENQIFYEFLFFDSETHPDVDVNAVEMVDGEPETLLDYIDDIFTAGPERQSHYDLQQLAELREMLVEEYGAKTAAELDY